MMAFRQFMGIVVICCLSIHTQAQTSRVSSPGKETEIFSKPYSIHSSGRQVIIKSTKNIKSIFVWTTNGHRIVEQKEINALSFIFRITISEKVFFVRVQLADGKTYSEKIGVQ